MKTTKEMIAVMQAYEEGKAIEYFYNAKWVKLDKPNWDWHHNIYRVKQEPEYVPYETVDEIVEASKVHGNFITKKPDCRDTTVYAISSMNNNGIYLYAAKYSFSEMFKLYNWADDGTSFGKLKK